MGLYRTTSETDGDFRRKLQNFPTPLVFCTPAEGVPLGIGYRHMESKKTSDGATGLRKKFDDIFSVTDGRTDGQTPGDSKDRAYA